MRPGAQVQLTLTLWDQYTYDEPADNYIHKALKGLRFVGSSDRRIIRDLFFRMLRREAYLQDKMDAVVQELRIVIPNRFEQKRIMYLIDMKERGEAAKLTELFTGEGHDPKPLTADEHSVLALHEIPSLTPHGALSLSPFWYEKLKKQFGEHLTIEAAAFAKEAPLDLRINTLRMSRHDGLLMLRRHNFEASQLPYSPYGVRMRSMRGDLSEYILSGDLEPQDEGSQLITLMCDVKPGMRVLDYCAGAGGKTLSLAMLMENKGTLIASDISKNRLDRASERLRRLGIHNTTTLSADGKWRKKQAKQFDRVLVDAPCSGSGTWRRNPDLMLRTSESDLAELIEKQRQILDEVAPLVKEGGRLIYATCSLITDENDAQAQWFLDNHPEFSLLPLHQLWQLASPPPSGESTWSLTPAQHGTDGFYMACFERRSS